ncbi:MAG: hypothetical protein HY089_07725 [Ignavibacteriales bacterium]|nr:hypothetical protein [Ignavibacteriales bacterium]
MKKVQQWMRQIFGRILIAVLLTYTGCEKKSDAIIDSTGIAPRLSNVFISPAIINTDTIFAGPIKNPTDVLHIQVNCFASELLLPGEKKNIQSAQARLTKDLGSSVIGTAELADDGVAPDQSKGDLMYSGKISFQITRAEFGTYHAEIFATDQSGHQSNGVILPLVIFRSNKPPTLSNLQAPDSVSLGNQNQTILLQVKATDPDGLNDIQKIIFNSFLPAGQPSSGNPFLMHDDGSNGDITAGDGTYSLRINLPATTSTGVYRFEFQAFDKSNEPSNTIIHRITVKP